TVAASALGAVTVWDVAGDRELYYLSDSSARFGEVAISPDSQLLAVPAWAPTHAIRILDLRTGKQKIEIETPRFGHYPCAFSPDGKKLISGINPTTTMWDLSTGKKLWDYRSKEIEWEVPFTVSADGRWVAVAEARQEIAILQAETGKKIQSLFIPRDYLLLHMTFSPDARTLFVSDFKAWTIFEIASGKPRLNIPSGLKGSSSLFATNGKRLAVFGQGSNAIDWLNPQTCQLLDSWRGHQFDVTDLAISEDGRKAVSSDKSGNVHVWDVNAGKIIRAPAGLASACNFLAFGDEDKTVLTCGRNVHFLSAKALEEEKRLPLVTSLGGQRIAHSPDRKLLAYAQNDETIVLIDVPGRKVLRSLKCPNWRADALVFGSDSKTLIGLGIDFERKPGSNASEQTSRVWVVDTGKQIESKQVSLGIFWDLAISSQGKLVTAAHKILVWDLATGKTEDLFDCEALRLLFSHDGNVLAANDGQKDVTILDFKKRTEIVRFQKLDTDFASWCFSRDDKILAIGHKDGSITFWSIPAGKKLAEIKGHRGPVSALAFSHDGETLVTGSSDGTILKWPAKAWRGK
ncbi:MAG TPA: WD40 repeat domain-containing protein, partial [Gemmataceae bacterium]|nr:WD40 repeat domain-containing protein [Gemmataceae bacterium]